MTPALHEAQIELYRITKTTVRSTQYEKTYNLYLQTFSILNKSIQGRIIHVFVNAPGVTPIVDSVALFIRYFSH
jgi:hypothetical protein